MRVVGPVLEGHPARGAMGYVGRYASHENPSPPVSWTDRAAFSFLSAYPGG